MHTHIHTANTSHPSPSPCPPRHPHPSPCPPPPKRPPPSPRYVEPLVENVTQLRNHRKFLDGDTNHINKQIRQQLSQQASNPNAGAYCVAIDPARPGTAYIAYGAGGPESSIYREWFNISPKGEEG